MVTIWPQISGGPHLLLKGVTLTVLPISGLGLATLAIWVPLESLGQAWPKKCTGKLLHKVARLQFGIYTLCVVTTLAW